MTAAKFDFPYDPQMGMAVSQAISNRGRFYSATELGRAVGQPAAPAPQGSAPAGQEDDPMKGLLESIKEDQKK